jgi:hypothetical protein
VIFAIQVQDWLAIRVSGYKFAKLQVIYSDAEFNKRALVERQGTDLIGTSIES